MSNFNSMSDMGIVLKKVWKLFNIVRNDVDTEDYSVVLLLIYLHSENLISPILNDPDMSKKALIRMLTNNNELSKQKLYDVFLPSIESLSEDLISDLFDVLTSIDSDWLNQNIKTVYDETLESFGLSQVGRKNPGFIQPKQLTEFVNHYIGSTEGMKIFNPFAGVASLIKDHQVSESVYAQELDEKTWAIGQLRLLVNQCSANFKCEDSVLNWPHNQKFDLIVSHPPFGMRLNRLYKDQSFNYRSSEEFIMNLGLDSLSNSGKLFAILPVGILFRGASEKELRKRLIEEDVIDTIISFPGGILPHTGISFILIVLNKAKERPEEIRIVKANDCIPKLSPKGSIIEVEKLLEVSTLNENSNSVRIITNDDVIANDFNLNIHRYFQDEIKGVKLKDLLTPIKCKRKKSQDIGKVIRILDLKDDRIDFHLRTEELEDSSLNKKDVREMDKSCLFLAKNGNKLKPTYFQFENQSIFYGLGLLPFHVDESKVDIAYLINELHADYVQKQLNAFRQTIGLPIINKDDLLEVKIKLPSIEEQRAKVTGIMEVSEKIKQLQSERDAIDNGVNLKGFNEFASLKHTLGRPRQNILGWSKNLSKFFVREKDNISALNDEFKTLFDLEIIEAIDEINRDIKFISDVLEKGENGLLLSDYEKEIIPLAKINDIINSLSNNEFKFSIKNQLLKVDKMKTRGILINKILFKILLDNILTNANKYGFKEKGKGNHVMIELSEIDDHLIFDVRNNGLPFPKNFDREKFITKYTTADTSNGSGLGGYDINRIVTYFGNENWDLILNADPIYPVIFRFSFPIKLLK